MSRKLWLRLLITALVAVLVFVTVRALTPATRFCYGLAPISEHDAILLTRRNEDDATYFWAQRVSDDGSLVWASDVTPFDTRDALGFSGIAAGAHTVVLLGKTRWDNTVAIGLSRDSGKKLWETTINEDIGPNRIGEMLLVDGPRVYVVHERPIDTRPTDTITALALDDGHVLWTRPPSSKLQRLEPVVRSPGRLVLTNVSNVASVELDGATGAELGKLPIQWFGCETPDALIGSALSDVLVVPRAGGEPKRAALAETELPEWDGPCGQRLDDPRPETRRDVVIGLAENIGSVRHRAIARLDPASGAVRWRLSLGPVSFGHGASADGRLPRFIPVTVFGGAVGGGGLRYEVVVVDLDQGVIVSRTVVSALMTAFVTAERAYTWGLVSKVLFALDPASGALTSATRLSKTNTYDPRPEDFRFGRWWLVGDGWAGPADLPFAVVDLANTKMIHLGAPMQAIDLSAPGWNPD